MTEAASAGVLPAARRAGQGSLAVSAWCVAASFGAYFCMYAFRRPFTACTYEHVAPWGPVGFKTLLVTAQVLGYTTSKFVGIKVIAEMPPGRRVISLLGLML